MIMPVSQLLDTTDSVPTISSMKNKTSPEKKITLYRQAAKDPKERTNSRKQLDSEYNLTLQQINLNIYTKSSPYTQEK